jgi:hypothetical protein
MVGSVWPFSSGKTTVIDGLLDGRNGVVSIPLKEKAIGQRDAGVRIVSDVLDCRIGDSLIARSYGYYFPLTEG